MGRPSSPARVTLAGTVALAVWLMLAAPWIERSVSGAELGPWRDIRLAIVGPLANVGGDLTGSRPASAMVRVEPTLEPPVATAGAETEPLVAAGPTPAAVRSPTAARPLRVLVMGDSMAGDLGRSLGRLTASGGLVAVDLDYRPASGLSRPDYLDWPAKLASDVSDLDPDVVVIELGTNDAQSFEVSGHVVVQGSDAWRAAYATRVSALLSVATAAGRHAILIGLPVMSDPAFGELMRRENDIFEQRAAGLERVAYLDTWSLFAGADGRYAAFLPDTSGRPQAMRQADGIHLSVAGAARLADAVADLLATTFAFTRS